MLDDGAIGRGDPSVRHHFRDSVSDTMRITDLAAPRKIPPGTGWRKFVYSVSFHKINPGESPRERHYRNLQGRIRRHIRRQYVITVVSGKGGVGVTTMAACIGGVFRECRPENVIAIDAVPSFGTLADRIDESPPGDYAAIINDTDVQGYADIREHLGQNTVGLDVLAGNRTSDQPRPLVPAMFSAVLSRLRRTHTVIVIDTSPDLEHDVMKAVLQSTDTLVFVSGITADRSRPVLRAVDYLRAQGYHELVSRSTVILNHTDSITDKDALAYLTERFTKVGAIVEAMPFDPHLAKGGIIDTVHELNKKSRLRLFEITAGLADKYVPDAERAFVDRLRLLGGRFFSAGKLCGHWAAAALRALGGLLGGLTDRLSDGGCVLRHLNGVRSQLNELRHRRNNTGCQLSGRLAELGRDL